MAQPLREETLALDPAQYAYNLILNTLGLGALPYVWSKTRNDPVFFKGRLGLYEEECAQTKSMEGLRPRIWFHAASVGEVNGAIPTLLVLLDRLPGAAVSLSVATPQGFRFARAELPGGVRVLPFPLDYPWVLKRAFRALRPDLYVALEGEFWPNLYGLLAHDHVPCILLNGRLSHRSAERYGLLKPVFRPLFDQFRWLAMLSQEDRNHVLSLGVQEERTLVLGSSKYDGLLLRSSPQRASAYGRFLDLSPRVPVVIGGSLRRSECVQVLEVFQRLREIRPDAVGLFAPRHLERLPSMVEWLERRSIPFQLLTHLEQGKEKRYSSVILVDRMGILFDLYALGDLIFCGGTLEPIGGHNIVEPAAWEKPVFYGPHLQKVSSEHTILQFFGGSFLVSDSQDLFRQWSHWIQNISGLMDHGKGAREALGKLGGVAEKQVDLILKVLSESEFQPSKQYAKT